MHLLRHWLHPSLFLIAIAVLLGPCFTQGKVLAFRDTLHFYYPLWYYLDQQPLEQRWIPSWNPYDAGGVPLAAEPTTAAFYPLRAIFFVPGWTLSQRIGLYLAIHLLLGYASTYWLARVLGLRSTTAYFAAMGYAFSGPVFFQVYNPVFLVGAAWLPVAGVGLVQLLEDRALFRKLLLLSLPLAMMTLGGDPQTAMHCVMLGTVLGVLDGFRRGALHATKAVTVLAVAALWAIGLSSIQILPTLYWARESGRGGVNADTFDFSIAPWQCATYLIPRCFGTFAGENSRWIAALQGEGRMWVPSLHVGTVAFVGLMVYLLQRINGNCLPDQEATGRQNSRIVRPLAIVFLLALVSSFGAYGVGWLLRSICLIAMGNDDFDWVSDPFGGLQWLWVNVIPGYASFRYPAKWLTVASLAASLLSGLCWERLIAIRSLQTKSHFLFSAGVVLLLVLVGWTYLPDFVSRWGDFCSHAPLDALCGPLDAEHALVTLRYAIGSTIVCWLFGWIVLARIANVALRWHLLLTVSLCELAFIASWDLCFVKEDKLIEASQVTRSLRPILKEPLTWEERSLLQVYRRLGKLHLLVPERNWYAQFSITPSIYSELRASSEVRNNREEVRLWNAGWNSRSNDRWSLLNREGVAIPSIVGYWKSPSSFVVNRSNPEETHMVLLPFRDDGGWSIDGAMPSAGAKLESNGVLSILVIDKGRSELVLRHRTPGLRVGATISLVFWSLLLAIGLISRQQWALRSASR